MPIDPTRPMSKSSEKRTMKLTDAVQLYSEAILQTRLARTCCRAYASFARSLCRGLTDHLGRDARCDDMTVPNVRRFLTARCELVCPGSAYQYHQMVGHFCKWLCDEGYTLTVATDKIARPHAERKTRQLPSPELIAALLDAPRKLHPPYRAALAEGLLSVITQVGLRPGEIMRLKLNHYDRQKRVLHIWHTKRNKSRDLPLADVTVKAIETYLLSRPADCKHDFLFAWNKAFGVGYVGLRALFHQVVHIAGIEEKLTPHHGRHICATNLVRSGADLNLIMTILGHSSLNATQQYLHADDGSMRDAMQKASAAAEPPPSPHERPVRWF